MKIFKSKEYNPKIVANSVYKETVVFDGDYIAVPYSIFEGHVIIVTDKPGEVNLDNSILRNPVRYLTKDEVKEFINTIKNKWFIKVDKVRKAWYNVEMKEIWRNIEGYEGEYLVSSLGRVKSIKKGKTTMLMGSVSYNGYKSVLLCRPQKIVGKRISRLVAQAFIPNPYDKPQVNHLDANKFNNKAENLEWCTAAENIRHSQLKGLNPKGSRIFASKLTEEIVAQAREEWKDNSLNTLAKKYGVTATAMSDALRGITWAHVKSGKVTRYADARRDKYQSLRDQGYKNIEIAKMFGVSGATVSMVLKRMRLKNANKG